MPVVVPGLSSEASSAPVESPIVGTDDVEIITARRDPLRDLPEWFEDFTENFVDAKSSFSGSDRAYLPEPHRPVPLHPSGSGEHNVVILLLKDPNCEICKRTKITLAPCWKRTSNHTRRAEKFGDLITADHKILSEEGESRSNHR